MLCSSKQCPWWSPIALYPRGATRLYQRKQPLRRHMSANSWEPCCDFVISLKSLKKMGQSSIIWFHEHTEYTFCGTMCIKYKCHSDSMWKVALLYLCHYILIQNAKMGTTTLSSVRANVEQTLEFSGFGYFTNNGTYLSHLYICTLIYLLLRTLIIFWWLFYHCPSSLLPARSISLKDYNTRGYCNMLSKTYGDLAEFKINFTTPF